MGKEKICEIKVLTRGDFFLRKTFYCFETFVISGGDVFWCESVESTKSYQKVSTTLAITILINEDLRPNWPLYQYVFSTSTYLCLLFFLSFLFLFRYGNILCYVGFLYRKLKQMKRPFLARHQRSVTATENFAMKKLNGKWD